MKASVPQKYLAIYAEPEARLVAEISGSWSHVVCIPACDEEDSLLATLAHMAQVPGAQEALVVVVLNGREDADEALHHGNARTAMQLRSACELKEDPCALGSLRGMNVLLVDRFSEGRRFPPRQGVGLARKIAGDLALSLIEAGKVSGSWIRCTDSDVEVPQDYFSVLSHKTDGVSGAVYPFVHLPEGDTLQQEAMRLYEAYLRYYVDGLQRAGSPYAYHSIGSLIAIDAQAYAVVRGFPKREAGEDFYLLNKLAKVGTVMQLDGAPVRIRGRVSHRVPFGTGAAVQSIRAELAAGRPYRVYDPRVFDALKLWIDALRVFAQSQDLTVLRQQIRSAPPALSKALTSSLEAQGAFDAAQKASAQVSGAPLLRRLMEWNDAFRTLKLIHALRDAGLGQIEAG
jgi:hypothetical protein